MKSLTKVAAKKKYCTLAELSKLFPGDLSKMSYRVTKPGIPAPRPFEMAMKIDWTAIWSLSICII